MIEERISKSSNYGTPAWYDVARVEWAFNKLMEGVGRWDRSSAFIVCTKSVADGLNAKLISLGWSPKVELLTRNSKPMREDESDLRRVTVVMDDGYTREGVETGRRSEYNQWARAAERDAEEIKKLKASLDNIRTAWRNHMKERMSSKTGLELEDALANEFGWYE